MAPAWPQIGSAVEIDGKIGQYVNTSKVVLTDGTSVSPAGKALKAPEQPGFDVLVGPMLNMDVLAEESAKHLFAKGYCVLQLCEESSKIEDAKASMKALHDDEMLFRLPTEVEEGYLGAGGKGRVAWLQDNLPVSDSLKGGDEFMTSLAYALMPYSSDTLGGIAEQRTPALLSLWLSDADMAEYPNPFADDKTLGTYLNSHHRGLLRATRFMGPDVASLTLTAKEKLPSSVEESKVMAGPNTILLFRPKVMDLAVSAGSEYLSMSVTFMSAEKTPEILGRWDVAAALTTKSKMGPPKPPKETCCVVNTSTRLHACWDDPEHYRAGLAGGCDAAVEFSNVRFPEWEMYYSDDAATAQPWHTMTKHMSYMEGIDRFDAKYFNIPAADVMGMDPMQRSTLEAGAMNLYQIGISKKYADRNPCHAGCAVGLDKDDWALVEKGEENTGGAAPNVQAIISNRFGFVFNMKGANFVADTACSASLSCLHLAKLMVSDRVVDKLEFFVVIGLHQCLSVQLWLGAHLGHMFSSTARCMPFNESADGYMRGDGSSGMLIKWETPKEDKDVKLRSTMVGQNGRAATLTAPNGVAQEDVIWKAIREAGIEPCETAIWSCHGTGTALGDPIEVGAMRKVQAKSDRGEERMVLNTNKGNCGHLEGGAAMTSLISMWWQLRCQKANPTCHCAVLNPHLEGTEFPGFYGTENVHTNIPQAHGNVSSFGFGGTNVHAVFWGEGSMQEGGDTRQFMKRLVMMQPPEIKPVGQDPADWETSGLEHVANDGDVYSVTITKGDAMDKPVEYVLEQEALGPDFDKNDTSYDIVFNDTEQITMEEGEVPGMRSVILEVPASGEISFNFVNTMESDLVVAPASGDRNRRKTSPISGPAEGLVNRWLIKETEGTLMQIDLFTTRGMMAVSWMEAEL